MAKGNLLQEECQVKEAVCPVEGVWVEGVWGEVRVR